MAAEISLNGATVERSVLAQSLGGVLAEKDSSALAVHLLRTLFALSLAGGSLVITGEAGDFRFEVGGGAIAPTDVIEALHEEFARADIAGLTPTNLA
jgi:hypothetical protein